MNNCNDYERIKKRIEQEGKNINIAMCKDQQAHKE